MAHLGLQDGIQIVGICMSCGGSYTSEEAWEKHMAYHKDLRELNKKHNIIPYGTLGDADLA